MGRMDDLFDRDSVQSDLDMQTLNQWKMADDLHAMRTRRTRRPSLARRMSRGGGRATSGWKNRGWFFWVMLIVMAYWFFFKPLGLTLMKDF